MRDFSNLVVSEREGFSGLTFDADNFSNAASYKKSYNIPEEEKLLVYADTDKCTDSLTGSGTFITDEAIYIHPAKKSWSEKSRIPLAEICNFLVYENKNSEVKLFGGQREYQIFACTKRSAKSTATELVKLLQSLQNSMMVYSDNKKSYERTVKKIFTLMRSELRKKGVLGEDFLKIVACMESVPYIRQEAVLLEMENAYRHCDEALYQSVLLEKSPLINEDTKRVLENPDDLFYVSFINDLSDKEAFTDVKALIEAYLKLKAQPKLSLREALILCHLCARMEDWEYLDKLLCEAGDDFEENELWSLLALKARTQNHRVHKNQAVIAGRGELLLEDVFAANDIGFSALHYALMLRNKELIRHVLSLADWTNFKSPFPKDRMVDAMFDPMFAVTFIFPKDETLQKDVFIRTSPKSTALNRSIARLDSMIDINIALSKKYPEEKAGYKEKIEELRSIRRDLKSERKKLIKAEVKKQKKMASIIRDAKHPLCDYIFEMYSSTQSLLDWLSHTAKDYRLSRYKNAFFITKPGEDIGLSYYEWRGGEVTDTNVSVSDAGYLGRDKRPDLWELRYHKIYENPSFKEEQERQRRAAEEKERRKREFRERVADPAPYAGSWFSETAHEDVRILKKEYRILLKKYHPDSSGDERTSKILMRIMNERADILDRMAKKP